MQVGRWSPFCDSASRLAFLGGDHLLPRHGGNPVLRQSNTSLIELLVVVRFCHEHAESSYLKKKVPCQKQSHGGGTNTTNNKKDQDGKVETVRCWRYRAKASVHASRPSLRGSGAPHHLVTTTHQRSLCSVRVSLIFIGRSFVRSFVRSSSFGFLLINDTNLVLP